MQKFSIISFVLTVLFIFPDSSFSERIVTTKWGGKAEIAYEKGFMYNLRKHSDGGVCLFNQELIENDSPGAGPTEKGIYGDVIWGKNRVRKIFYLDDPRAYSAYIVILPCGWGSIGKYPLKAAVNGHEFELSAGWKEGIHSEYFRWNEFPAKWLIKGENVVDLYCPAAKKEDDGWGIWAARDDEYERGGVDPSHVGETSFKSIDGGKTWLKSPFSPFGQTRIEYSIRLSLDRYLKEGWLASPVIDLWKGDSNDFIVPLRIIQKMKLEIRTKVPKDTRIKYFFRRGRSPQPFSDDWEAYRSIGEGSKLDFEIGGADLNRRYVQFKAELSTNNRLESPIIKQANITAELREVMALYKNIHVVEMDNPKILYSSIDWEWESWDRPELKELRERENFDRLLADCETELEAQLKLCDYATKRWTWDTPFPGDPLNDALSILDRVESVGAGGYCTNTNYFLAGICTACGWQARQVESTHSIMEVWNNDFGKWIFMDAGLYHFSNHYHYDPETAEPLDLLELHQRWLDYFYPGHVLDWMKDNSFQLGEPEMKKNQPPPVKRGSKMQGIPTKLSGFYAARYVRIIPRNNWFEKPYPKPLMDSSSMNLPEREGYVNWYDEQSPPKRQYTWFTDRKRDMWPDLNKVHIDATSGFGNERLFLRFETYTPNFCHFEIDVNDKGWQDCSDRWTWFLQSGRNTLRVRAVNKFGVGGKPSRVFLNHADAPQPIRGE